MYGFDRLIKKMDEISNLIDEKVILQIGKTEYKPKYASYFNFINEKKFIELVNKTNLIVSHAGVGTILTAQNFKKQIIIVPRMKELNEHVDNHQVEIAKKFQEELGFHVVYDVDKLHSEISNLRKIKNNFISEKNIMIKRINEYLKHM